MRHPEFQSLVTGFDPELRHVFLDRPLQRSKDGHTVTARNEVFHGAMDIWHCLDRSLPPLRQFPPSTWRYVGAVLNEVLGEELVNGVDIVLVEYGLERAQDELGVRLGFLG